MKAIWRNTRTDAGAPAAPPAASSTRTTKEKVPVVVGLPVALPLEDSVTPGGSAPPEIDHLYGLTPPAATTVTVPYVTPTSPKWNGRVLMMSFAGLGDAIAVGEAVAVGDSAGVGAVLGVTTTVDGLASGEAVPWLVCGTQAAKNKTRPATHATGTTPLLTRL